MKAEEFVDVIRKVVRDSAIDGTIEILMDPPGRKVPEDLKEVSEWFNELPDEDQEKIRFITTMAVDGAVFGLFATLDGSRAIESGNNKGRLELRYVNKSSVELLNDVDRISLTEIYNAVD